VPGRAAGLGALALALVLALELGCQTSDPLDGEPATAAPVWPPAPARARIRFVTAIAEPADLGIRPGLLRRLWGWIAGSEEEHLVRPHGLALDARGRLWVVDPGARRVHVFDAVRRRHMSLPREGAPPFVSPIAVTHDARGTAYVSDSAARRIRRFSPDGEDLGDWDGGSALVRPTGVAFDERTGLLWVADTGSHRLLGLDARGAIRRSIGGRGSGHGRFNFPTHVTIDPAGRFVVTDTLNFRVQILSPEGEFLAELGELGDGPGSLSKPKGVALDRDGHVYVVDAMFGNVQIFDEQGRVLLYFGSQGAGPGEFWLPAGVCIGGGDRIYVADAYNQRVQVFEYLGE
jgi:DNA-binding beta-propeller fold protein YncE